MRDVARAIGALAAAQKRTGSTLLAGCRAHIIVELDGQERSVRSELRQLEGIVRASRPVFVQRGQVALDDLFRQVLAWGGVITGEHGVGLAKLRWWRAAASPEVRALHRAIKRARDPKGILNPGKFL